MLRSDLRDYNDDIYRCERKDECYLKNNAPLRPWVSKITNIFIENVEDLDIVIPMYNLLEYSYNHSVTSERLWNY